MTARRPGPRVLVTRPADQSAELMAALRDLGLEPVLVPAIGIELGGFGGALARAAGSLDMYSWVVVTSANGARAILRMTTDEGAIHPGRPAWAAIGPATGGVLAAAGIPVAFQPSAGNGVGMAIELPLGPGDRVLVVRGDLADGTLADHLRTRGAEVDDVVAYRTRVAPSASRPLLRAAMREGLAAVILASGSAVHGLLALADAEALDITSIPAVCIGPETERTATAAGLPVAAVAPSPDAMALATAAAGAVAGAIAHRSLEIA
jgi:uroporphyrinogen-III synthase